MEVDTLVTAVPSEKLPDIRHLTAALESPTILAAEYKRTIYTLNIENFKLVSTLCTLLDWGGRRIAIRQDGSQCVVGNFFEGVALYDVLSGAEIWRRPDLKQVQYIALGCDDRTVFCGFEKGPGQVMCRDSGKTLRVLRGVKRLYEDPYTEIAAFQETKTYIVQNTRAGNNFRVRLKGPVQDIAFAGNRVCFGGTELHCYDLGGMLQWQVTLPGGQMVTTIRYLANERLFGVVRHLEVDELYLVEFDGETGEIANSVNLGTAELAVFCFKERIICSDGRLWDVISGTFIGNAWNCGSHQG